MSALLDTNVLSELLRAPPEPAVLSWFARQPAESLFVSAVTQAEMMLGARLLPAGKRRNSLQAALAAMFDHDFAGHCLPFGATAVPAYVDIVTTSRAAGRPISQFDAQIAAIASERSMTLVTRNVADYSDCGLALVNPWQTA